MNKTNRNNLIKVVVAVVLFLVAVFVVQQLTGPKVVEGSKTIEIVIIDESGDTETVVHEGSYKTDAQLLSEFLLELEETGIITLELEGSKDDPYGRSIVMLMEMKTEDWNTGPWWVFESATNTDCLSAGFCAGIDFTPLYDNDNFQFNFITSFE